MSHSFKILAGGILGLVFFLNAHQANTQSFTYGDKKPETPPAGDCMKDTESPGPQLLGYAVLRGKPVAVLREFQPDIKWKNLQEKREASAKETGCVQRVGRDEKILKFRGDAFLDMSKEYQAVGNDEGKKTFASLAESERLLRAGLLLAVKNDEEFPLQRIDSLDQFKVLSDRSLLASNETYDRFILFVSNLQYSAFE